MSGGFHIPGTEEDGAACAAPSPISLLRKAIAWICAVLLIAMMVLTVADVVGRYLFNSPLDGATEVTELLLTAVVFMGLPAATLDRDHVTVDFVTSKLSTQVERLRVPLVGLISACILGCIAWRLWAMGDQIAGYGGTTVTLAIPIAPAAYFAAVMTGISACIIFGLGMAKVWRR